MSDPKIIRTTVISNVTEVHIYPETIQKIKEGHPEVPVELPSVEAAIENAIVNPTHVEKSYNRSYVFVDASSTNWSGDPLRVPVKVVGDEESTSSRLKSAYFALADVTDLVIWQKEDGGGK